MKVLLLSEDHTFCKFLVNRIDTIDANLTYSNDINSLLVKIQNRVHFDVVVIDIHIYEYSLDRILTTIKTSDRRLPIILIADGSEEDFEIMEYYSDRNLIQEIALKGTSSKLIQDLLEAIEILYTDTKNYR